MFMLANFKNNVKENKVMGIYLVQNYKKDKNGRWKLTSEKLDRAPHDIGRWKVSSKYDNTFYATARTKGGLNEKVVSSTSYFDNMQSKVRYGLLTTSSKLSKKDKEKYSKVKNAKYF